MPDRQTIAIAGAGDLGKYICEELLASDRFDVVVLSRTAKNVWCSARDIPVHSTDYTLKSLSAILNETCATTVISFINLANSRYIDVHAALLAACKESQSCKRLVPSEWIGDSETYPLKPNFYASTREPFRQMLRAQTEVEWTLINIGWLADYFLPKEKTYMRPIPDKFPVDPNSWQALVRGTGDEGQSWSCGRDVGKAVVELCSADAWEQVTYITGEWSTFNRAIKTMESFYGRPLPCTHKSVEEIEKYLTSHKEDEELSDEMELAQIEELMVRGRLKCPEQKTLRQRQKYFATINFLGLEQLLRHAASVEFV